MKIARTIQTACALATLLILAACTQDEGMDSKVQNLPKGKYPLTFTTTQDEVATSPQTRVSDKEEDGKHKSQWTTGDQIKVVVSEGGNDMKTTCTLDENSNITTYNPQLYWKTTQTSKINAWYSNITGDNSTASSIISLSDQSSTLVYVLKADEVTNASYQSKNISLNFKHQLAKVRVKVVKGTYTGALDVTAVSVKGYTSCTVSNGTVMASGSSSGNISMHEATYGSDTYWEANLVPGTDAMNRVITINADSKNTTCTLASDVTLAAGSVYTYTVTVNAAQTESKPDENGSYTINENDNVYITGEVTGTINIKGNASVELKNVSSTVENSAPIIVEKGTPTIIITGTNTLKASSSGTRQGGIMLKSNTGIIIEGTGVLNIEVNPKESPGIGAGYNQSCGDIIIRNITLNVTGNGGAGIGNAHVGECGDIKIINATVNATGSPAIGASLNEYTGFTSQCGNIYIEDSSITATGTVYYGIHTSAIGSGGQNNGAHSVCGNITIINNDKTESEILSTIKAGGGTAQRIGKGESLNTNGSVTCGKITIISKDGTKEYSNGVD